MVLSREEEGAYEELDSSSRSIESLGFTPSAKGISAAMACSSMHILSTGSCCLHVSAGLQAQLLKDSSNVHCTVRQRRPVKWTPPDTNTPELHVQRKIAGTDLLLLSPTC